MSWKYLNFFMEDDDELAEIGEKYKKGELLTGEVKAILIEIMSSFTDTNVSAPGCQRALMAWEEN